MAVPVARCALLVDTLPVTQASAIPAQKDMLACLLDWGVVASAVPESTLLKEAPSALIARRAMPAILDRSRGAVLEGSIQPWDLAAALIALQASIPL